MIRACTSLLIAVIMILGWLNAAPAEAEPEPSQREGNAPLLPQPLDAVPQRPLFEDWALRHRLEEDGVVITAHEIGELAANTAGYKGTGADYANHIDLAARIDLAKAGAPFHGTLRIGLSDRLGSLNSDRFGAFFQTQAFYGQGRNARFDELSYERVLVGPLSVKLGFYSMGNDYAGLSYTCNFTTNAFCGHPLSLLYGSGWVDSPTGQWGARLKWQASDKVSVEIGGYDVNPQRKQAGHGFDLGFAGTTGAIIPLEVNYVTGQKAEDYPGTLKMGIYYDTSRVSDIANPLRQVRGRGGIYVQGAKQVWKVHPGALQGLSLFGVATLNDSATGLFRSYYEAGASLRGPFRGRGDDVISLGWVVANINARLRDAEIGKGQRPQTSEEMVEVNYTVQASRSLLVRPGLQYSIRPGGYTDRPDTLVFTLHVQATL